MILINVPYFSELPDFYVKVFVKVSEDLEGNLLMPEVVAVQPEVVKLMLTSGAGSPGVN